MSDMPPFAFLSYTHFDDTHDEGFVAWLCDKLSSEVHSLTASRTSPSCATKRTCFGVSDGPAFLRAACPSSNATHRCHYTVLFSERRMSSRVRIFSAT